MAENGVSLITGAATALLLRYQIKLMSLAL
jgi:hypothetical protein